MGGGARAGVVAVAGDCPRAGLGLAFDGLGTATVVAPGFMSQAARTRNWRWRVGVAMVAATVAIVVAGKTLAPSRTQMDKQPPAVDISPFPLFVARAGPPGSSVITSLRLR